MSPIGRQFICQVDGKYTRQWDCYFVRPIGKSMPMEILQTLKSSDPTFFENIVVELLVKMGYGEKSLARSMIDFGVGVTTVGAYEVKKLDSDYFSEG